MGRWKEDDSSGNNGDGHGPRHGDGGRRRPHGRMAPHDPPPLRQTPRQGLPDFSLLFFSPSLFRFCLDLLVGEILFLLLMLGLFDSSRARTVLSLLSFFLIPLIEFGCCLYEYVGWGL